MVLVEQWHQWFIPLYTLRPLNNLQVPHWITIQSPINHFFSSTPSWIFNHLKPHWIINHIKPDAAIFTTILPRGVCHGASASRALCSSSAARYWDWRSRPPGGAFDHGNSPAILTTWTADFWNSPPGHSWFVYEPLNINEFMIRLLSTDPAD